jgi:hypothetical protein
MYLFGRKAQEMKRKNTLKRPPNMVCVVGGDWGNVNFAVSDVEE